MYCGDCHGRDHTSDRCPWLITCSNCQGQDHQDNQCLLPKQFRCSKCNRANTRTVDCGCELGLWTDMQTLRLVGPRDRGIPLIDVTVYENKYVAAFNINSSDTFVSKTVANEFNLKVGGVPMGLYNQEGELKALEIHIMIGDRMILHPCYITEAIAHDLVLGMDFLKRYGFGFRVGAFEVNNHSPTFNMAQELCYWQNLTVNSNDHQHPRPQVNVDRAPPAKRVLEDCRRMTFEEWSAIMKRKMKENPVDPDVLALYPSDTELDF